MKYEKWITPKGTVHFRISLSLRYLCGAPHRTGHKRTNHRICVCEKCAYIRKSKERKERKW